MCCHFFFTFYERENCNLKRQGNWPETKGHKLGHQLAQTSSRSLLATFVSYLLIAVSKQLTNTSQWRSGLLWLLVTGATGCPAEEDEASGRKGRGLTLQVCIFDNALSSLSPQSIVKDLWFQLFLFSHNFIHVKTGFSHSSPPTTVLPPSLPTKSFFLCPFWACGFLVFILSFLID